MSAKEPTYHLVHFFKFNLLDLNGALNQSQRHVRKSLESLLKFGLSQKHTKFEKIFLIRWKFTK